MTHQEGLKTVMKHLVTQKNNHLDDTHRLRSTLNDTMVTVCVTQPGRRPSSRGLLLGISRTVAGQILI